MGLGQLGSRVTGVHKRNLARGGEAPSMRKKSFGANVSKGGT